jgi:deoxyribodipyrimidine photo-lyase
MSVSAAVTGPRGARPALVWLRNDLRLGDNPALAAALRAGARPIPVYVHAPEEDAPWQPGGASRAWLHRSLEALAGELAARGSRLVVRQGQSLDVLRRLVHESGATAAYWNRRYEPAAAARDRRVELALCADGLEVHTFNGALLNEPWDVVRAGGLPYRVFTPYWKACQRSLADVAPLPAPEVLPPVAPDLAGLPVAALGLRPAIGWDSGFWDDWMPGEPGACGALSGFLDRAIAGYDADRNRPDVAGTSRLSPHLHFGEISPRQVLAAVRRHADSHAEPGLVRNAEAYVRELGWREFGYHLLHHYPHTSDEPLDARFKAFPWAEDYAGALAAWQRGRTGIPIVDAGMRELWRTGWMHNRVRMIAASLLTKNLLVPWQAGARWFWDTLVDADLANNTLGWQWTAGCGADAAPYFRIFNPVLQGQRFDPDGTYVRRWLPELARLPADHIHAPWRAPGRALAAAGVALGRDYPLPIVDLQASRAQALARFAAVKRD